MDSVAETLNRFCADLSSRPGGPMAFRFFLQPGMALLLAFRDGVKDARAGRSPYLWKIAHGDPAVRRMVALAFIPHLLVRGPLARIARRWIGRH